MDELFDFSQPAQRAQFLIIRSAKIKMILVIVIGGLVSLISFPNNVLLSIGIILLAIVLCYVIRDSTFYRLAILEACENIEDIAKNKSKDDFQAYTPPPMATSGISDSKANMNANSDAVHLNWKD